jgi:hypothetical protein
VVNASWMALKALNHESFVWERTDQPIYSQQLSPPMQQIGELFLFLGLLSSANVQGTTNLRSPSRRHDFFLIEQAVVADQK